MSQGLFSQSMTGKPYSCLPLDLWIEMTMNEGSKMNLGWVNILKNEKLLFEHHHEMLINRVRTSLHSLANKNDISSNQIHAENSGSRLQKDKEAVQDIDNCITEFKCDPFDVAQPLSGLITSEELVKGFKTAHEDGEKCVQILPLTATVHRHNRRSFSKPPLPNDRNKIIDNRHYGE